METIFDHNPTKEELKRFPWASDKIVAEMVLSNQDNNYFTLGLLFAMRNKKDKANGYYSKIVDKSILSTLMQDIP